MTSSRSIPRFLILIGCFGAGILVSYSLEGYRAAMFSEFNSTINGTKFRDTLDETMKDEKIRNSNRFPAGVIDDISLVVKRIPRAVPSLQEDWGNVKCPTTKLSNDSQNLFDYISAVTLPCSKKVMIGGQFRPTFFDGEKWACLDPGFKFKHGNCTVLSYGISNDWSFDDEMDATYMCKVYSFDPTIGQKDHKRLQRIQFFNMGISDGPGKLQGGKLESYSKILEMLNLTNTVIDYLKMDVEGAEFPFLKNVLSKTPNLLKNVRQIGMEIHLGGLYKEAWESFQQLDCLGFRVMFVNFNPAVNIIMVNGKRRAELYEIVWAQDRSW